jgi:hypothetical protein
MILRTCILLIASCLVSCAGGTVSPGGGTIAGGGSGGSSGITSNYTGVVSLTNRANVFGGNFTVGNAPTIRVTGSYEFQATNGLWYFSYSRANQFGGAGVSYVYTNANDSYLIVYDPSVDVVWYYGTGYFEERTAFTRAGTIGTTNWNDSEPDPAPVDFQAKLGNVFITGATIPTIPTITLASSSGGIVDNSADGYTGKQIRVSSDTDVGVSGNSSADIGVYGVSSAAEGVSGYSTAYVGVLGTSSASYAVYGYSTASHGVYGESSSDAGVYGYSDTSDKYGVYGTSIGGHGVYSAGDLYAPSNSAAYVTFNSPTVSVVLGSNWTNTYCARIQLIVDGTLNMAVAGSTVLTFTNLTTAESHIVAGTTISIAGVTYFSDKELISSNNIIKYTAANTGTATTTLTKTTVKIQ